MARYTNVGNVATRPVWIWDVTLPIGPALDNRRTDIMLVQCLINEVRTGLSLMDLRKSIPGPGFPTFEPLAQLVEDGKWGPETANAVKSYQESATRRHGGKRDGRVDPVHPLLPQLIGDPVGQSVMTAHVAILHRTVFCLNADHLMLKGRMMHESEFPFLLQAELNAQKS